MLSCSLSQHALGVKKRKSEAPSKRSLLNHKVTTIEGHSQSHFWAIWTSICLEYGWTVDRKQTSRMNNTTTQCVTIWHRLFLHLGNKSLMKQSSLKLHCLAFFPCAFNFITQPSLADGICWLHEGIQSGQTLRRQWDAVESCRKSWTFCSFKIKIYSNCQIEHRLANAIMKMTVARPTKEAVRVRVITQNTVDMLMMPKAPTYNF